jgi:hypothetical protein
MTYLLQFTKSVQKFPRQHDCALQLVCEDCVLFVSVKLYVFALGTASKMLASNLTLVPTFFFGGGRWWEVKLRSSTNLTNKNLAKPALETQTAVPQ